MANKNMIQNVDNGQSINGRYHGRACMLGHGNTAHLDDSAILAKQAMIAGNPAILDVS